MSDWTGWKNFQHFRNFFRYLRFQCGQCRKRVSVQQLCYPANRRFARKTQGPNQTVCLHQTGNRRSKTADKKYQEVLRCNAYNKFPVSCCLSSTLAVIMCAKNTIKYVYGSEWPPTLARRAVAGNDSYGNASCSISIERTRWHILPLAVRKRYL